MGLEGLIAHSRITLCFGLGLAAVCGALALLGWEGSGCRTGYTLRRLRVGERALPLLWGGYGTLCLLFYWAAHLGTVLALCAAAMPHLSEGAASPLALFLALFLNGASDSMSKFFTQWGQRRDDGLFVFYIFLFAGLFTLVLLLKERRPITRRDLVFGALVGVPNFLSSRLLLAALTELPAFLVYPSYSVGVILIVSLLSFFLFRERLGRRQLAAVGMILAALVLLNL